MDNLFLTLVEWENTFAPYQDEDGQEIVYEPRDTYGQKYMKNQLESLTKKHGTMGYQHVWTKVDGDNGKLILLNGYHLVNRLDYIVCEEPWGEGNHSDKDMYIEVKYEE